ncbi:MAG: class I SAM-dependent methyltransferase [Phycisphaerales bacterium]|nr:class I SAM-dependent methyltransferase [Phycisphaerales bacterium]
MGDHRYSRGQGSITGIPYRCAFWAWRRIPEPWRNGILRSRAASSVKVGVRNLLARGASRDDLYSDEYYSYVDQESARSAPAIVSSITRDIAPRTVVDVGCGTGALLAEFRSRGVSGVGLEYSESALRTCRERGLDARPFDIESAGETAPPTADLAVCFEVAEHLPERCADLLVALLVRCAPAIAFTAATPGQGGGADHVNEQPHEYWIEKFSRSGMALNSQTSRAWRKEWESANVAGFYSANIMVFTRDAKTPTTG